MDRYTDLSVVLTRVWERLGEASGHPGHPYRHLQVGTVAGTQPRIRTVVLRRVDSDERRLAFHTDRRSGKVSEIRSNERTTWHAWDAECREQIRLQGASTVHEDDRVADDLWSDQRPASLAVYPRETAPGTPLDHPGETPAMEGSESPTRSEVSHGRPYFAVVRTVIDEIDWLHLHPEGHCRALFQFDRPTQSFDGRWIAP